MLWVILFIFGIGLAFSPGMHTLKLAGHENTTSGRFASGALIAIIITLLLFALAGAI